MKAVVTGATGFVGRALCRRLVDGGWSVSALHRRESDDTTIRTLRDIGVDPVRITDTDVGVLMEDLAPHAVFHLAAHQARHHDRSDLDRFIDTNVRFGTQLLDSLQGTSTILVSAMSYFQFRNGAPVAHSLYAATKQAFWEIERFYRDLRQVDVRDVVLFDNFGPDDPRDKLIPQLILALREQTPIGLGPASQPIDLLFVDDVADGLIAAAAVDGPALTTVRSERPTTVGAVVAELERISGVALDTSFDETRLPNDQPIAAGDWPRPPRWAPSNSLSGGLEVTLATTTATGPRPGPTAR